MTDKMVMSAAGLDKNKYPGLKMPSPEFNLARLKANKPTGLLSRIERKGRVGADQALVNELSKPEDTPFAFAIISFGSGKKYAGVGALPPAVAQGLDEFTRREFQTERNFWYHEFKLVKAFKKPIPLTKPLPGRRFASDLDVSADRAEPVATEKWEGVPDPFADDDGHPKEPGQFNQFEEPMAKYAAVVPGASAPWRTARLEAKDDESAVEEAGEVGVLRGLGEVLLAQRVGIDSKDRPIYKVLGTVLAADASSDVARAIEAGDPVKLREMDIDMVRAGAEMLRRFHHAEFEGKDTTVVGGLSREDVLNAYVFIVRELRRRGEKVEPKREIDSEAMDLVPDLFNDGVVAARFLTEDELRRGKIDVDKIGTGSASIKRVIEGAKATKLRTLKAMPVHEMMEALERFHHKHFDGNAEKSAEGITRSSVLSAFRATVRDLIGRGAKLKAGNPLAREAAGRWPTLFQKSEDDGRECAPTHASGKQAGRRIHLHEVLEKIRPFRFRQDAITIVGGLANRGWTDNDIDVLIKGPLDEDTLHVLKFRFGRMLGPELSQRVQFLTDAELGGPFTDHVPLGNLMFETVPEFQVKEMRGLGVSKQDDPLQDLPLKPGKRDAVVQIHARGKTVHLDFRIAVRDYLIGWTLPLQVQGAIKEPITTVAQLKAIARNYDVETGNKFLKPILAPKGLFATPKSRQPLIWLKIEDRIFPPGTVGATKEFPGVITVIDRPKVEFGQQSPRFHEYFITDSKLKSGLWFVRMLVGEKEEVPEAEVGRVTPAGEIFWKFSISKLFMPSILKPRTVQRKVMPPDGWSWIPQSLERDVPAESKYWTKKGAEARKVRDALVEERTFTEKTVGLVDGEFRLVRAKRYVVNDGVGVGVVQKQPKRTAYVLSRQSFRGPIVVRAGFSKAFWWLVVDKPDAKGVWAWRLQTDPLGGEERISAVEASAAETRDKALLTLSGDQPPSSKWNPTKATPSDVRPVGKGRAELLEAKSGFLRLRFTSGPLRGVWSLAAEEPDSLLWEFSTGSVPGEPMDKARGEGMGVGGPPTQDGGTDSCVCSSCGITTPHTRGIPCAEVICPKCGRAMIGSTVKAEIPIRDGVQIWDPDKKRPDMDRTDLRPLAKFAPMKPREGFFDPNKLINNWATPKIVKAGLDAEPKLNGLRCVAEVDDRGQTLIYFEDSRDDRSKILPGVAAEIKALGKKIGPFILDCELIDFDAEGNAQPRRTLARFTGPVKPQDDSRVNLMAFRLVYGLGKNWTDAPRSEARPALEDLFKKAGKLKHFKLLPFMNVKTVADIPSLIKWATEQQGGEGAMFKTHESTYTLGRFTSSWSKLKLARTVRGIVTEKILKKPAPGQKAPSRTFVYRCGVGPILKKNLDDIGGLVKIREEWYSEIGKTFATNVQARVGQTLEVQATEFLVDLSVPKKTVHWFTPVVVAQVDERPSTFDEVVDAVFEHEIKRPVEKLLDGPIRLLKAEGKKEERFVLGVVSEPRTDSQEDLAPKLEIRNACHEYMEFYRGTGLMHRERLFGGRVRICECWFQRGDTEINGEPVHDGSWLMAWRIVDDALWADVKAGKLTGFSIQGSAVREPAK